MIFMFNSLVHAAVPLAIRVHRYRPNTIKISTFTSVADFNFSDFLLCQNFKNDFNRKNLRRKKNWLQRKIIHCGPYFGFSYKITLFHMRMVFLFLNVCRRFFLLLHQIKNYVFFFLVCTYIHIYEMMKTKTKTKLLWKRDNLLSPIGLEVAMSIFATSCITSKEVQYIHTNILVTFQCKSIRMYY